VHYHVDWHWCSHNDRPGLKVTCAGLVVNDEFDRFMLAAMEDRSINTTCCILDPVVLIGLSGILSLPGD
jgi:sugar/nucleoside kinase (ribokinase family)